MNLFKIHGDFTYDALVGSKLFMQAWRPLAI